VSVPHVVIIAMYGTLSERYRPRSAMNVGVGIPNSVPGARPATFVDWARRAEACGFSSIGVVDRIAYDSVEPFTALAAAAAATERIGLVTMIVIGPLRAGALLAKQAGSVNALSGGRLTLGLAVGARHDDYEVAGVEHRSRGEVLSRQLVELRRPPGSAVAPDGGVPEAILVGGSSDDALTRMARHADGYVHGGGPPRAFARAVDRVATAWAEAGRSGAPRLWAQAYFALGPDAAGRGVEYMRDYYSFTGPFAERIAEGLLTTPQSVVQLCRGYAEAGCDELVLLPAVADVEQVDRLADVVGTG
jgi:alkanesulfonate monooxygenase SsuD/methylene tetrahydromethanopterin reductase-like flavin-dependent oxidoreductase (luciferase family)